MSERRTRAQWWRHYFDQTFYDLHLPLFTEADSRAEVAAMIELLGLPLGARVLDVPCGWGRHTGLLASAGFDTVGADLSRPLLSRAADRARGDGENAPADLRDGHAYVAADVRALPFEAASFQGAVDVFTSIGLFDDPADDERALAEIRRVLEPGGRLLLETMHWDDVRANYAARDGWTLPDGTRVSVRRRLYAQSRISAEVMHWRRGGESGSKRHTLRIYSADEVLRVLRRVGFDPVAAYGDWTGRRFNRHSPTLIVVGEAGPHEALTGAREA